MGKSKLAQVLGFERSQSWWYRDLALASVGGIALLWAAVAAVQPAAFDRKLAVGCVVVFIVCCLASPNRMLIAGVALGIVSMQGWFSVAFAGNRYGWAVAITSTLLVAVILAIYSRRPLVEK
jgi:hypothetical protein